MPVEAGRVGVAVAVDRTETAVEIAVASAGTGVLVGICGVMAGV